MVVGGGGGDSIDFVVVVFHFPTLIRFGLVQCYRLSQVFVRDGFCSLTECVTAMQVRGVTS